MLGLMRIDCIAAIFGRSQNWKTVRIPVSAVWVVVVHVRHSATRGAVLERPGDIAAEIVEHAAAQGIVHRTPDRAEQSSSILKQYFHAKMECTTYLLEGSKCSMLSKSCAAPPPKSSNRARRLRCDAIRRHSLSYITNKIITMRTSSSSYLRRIEWTTFRDLS